MNLEKKLEYIRDFQKEYIYSHVGGSIGLMLQGVDLQRELGDIDITTNRYVVDSRSQEKPESNDFTYSIVQDGTTIDIRIDDSQPSIPVLYNDHLYYVTPKENILKFKGEYAMKGIQKHIEDLIVVATGIRYVKNNDVDDLPF